MSWWVYLEDHNRKPCNVPVHREGGTHVLNGTQDAELNITYNYSKFYYLYLDSEGLRWLNERKAKSTIDALEYAVGMLGTDQDPDYWKGTRGNAGHALSILLNWAKLYPEAVFRVS